VDRDSNPCRGDGAEGLADDLTATVPKPLHLPRRPSRRRQDPHINEGKHYIRELPEFHLAPISMTFASLVDSLVKAKRHIIRPGEDPMEYNSMSIFADEMGAFIHKYDNEMIDGLSAF
jgi:hypothetical protein